MAWSIEFERDPAAFLSAAGDFLAQQPVVSTVVSTIAERAAREVAAGIDQPDEDWWLVVRDGSAGGGGGDRPAGGGRGARGPRRLGGGGRRHADRPLPPAPAVPPADARVGRRGARRHVVGAR